MPNPTRRPAREIRSLINILKTRAACIADQARALQFSMSSVASDVQEHLRLSAEWINTGEQIALLEWTLDDSKTFAHTDVLGEFPKIPPTPKKEKTKLAVITD